MCYRTVGEASAITISTEFSGLAPAPAANVWSLYQNTISIAATAMPPTGTPIATPKLTLHDAPNQPLSHVHAPLPSVAPLPSHMPWPLHTTMPARPGHGAQAGPKYPTLQSLQTPSELARHPLAHWLQPKPE
jgi:hypothetical protein